MTAPLSDEELQYVQSLFDHAREGRTSELTAAVDAGVPVDLTNSAGDTLLILAAYHVQLETVNALLARGADTSRVNDKGQTALGAAVFRQSTRIVTALLDAGADPTEGPKSAVEIAEFFALPAMLKLVREKRSPGNTVHAQATSVAIIGSGAVAGLLASWLDMAGAEVPLLCARSPVDAFVVTGDGKGSLDTRTVPVEVVDSPEQARPVDWVLLTVKAQDTESTRPWLDALVGPETVVVVLQNGVNHLERVQPLVGDARVLPALVLASAERTAPGAITHYVGTMLVVPECAPAQRLTDLLGAGVLVRQDPDFRTAAWRKLMVNIGSNPVTALTMRRSEVLHLPEIQDLCRMLLQETVAVGVAVGAKLDESDVEKVLRTYQSYPDDNGTSMYYDRMAGRPLEHDLLSGAVVRAAAEHGVAAPANRVIRALSRTCA